MTLLLTLCTAFVGRAYAAARARTVVEVGPVAEQHVDAKLVRRLVMLELGDVSIPAPATAKTHSESPTLFVRIVAERKKLTVELWDRGELAGQRRLSLEGSGPLTARRIALASAVLARQLRERRVFEARAHRRRQAQELAKRNRPKPFGVPAQPLMSASGRVAWAPRGGGLFVGPQLSGGLRLQSGPDMMLAVGLLGGKLVAVGESPSVELYEVSLRPGYARELLQGHVLRVGLAASLGVLHVAGSKLAEPNASEAWSARGAAELSWRARASEHVDLEAGVEIGALLRNVRFAQNESLGGVWLGAALGASFH